jgi:hypothetical protein
MDLRSLIGVLWRFRVLVLSGVLLASGLALLAMTKPALRDGKPALVFRQPKLWQSDVTLLVTQAGFPEGRTVYPTSPTLTPSGESLLPSYAAPSRFSDLAVLYAELAMSNRVQREILGAQATDRETPYVGVIAAPVPSPTGVGFLPLLKFTGISTSPKGSFQLAQHAGVIFRQFLEEEQAASKTPRDQRVQLVPLATSLRPTVYQGRKMTGALLAFFVVAMLTVATAFLLENIRPRPPTRRNGSTTAALSGRIIEVERERAGV